MKIGRSRFIVIAVLGWTLLDPGQSIAADRPVLAELFTSQSCSSCPPADALLGDLAQRRDVVALSFHVDYWDDLGWKDPYSSRAATARQRRYAEILGSQVYTPQLVVDGRAETVGSDRRGVEALLQRPRDGVALAITRGDGGRLDIHIDGASSAAGKITAEILLVTFDPMHKTPVRGGENGGRSLVTYNDVRSFRVVGAWRGDPVALDLAPGEAEIGECAAVIVQSPDGVVWAIGTAP